MISIIFPGGNNVPDQDVDDTVSTTTPSGSAPGGSAGGSGGAGSPGGSVDTGGEDPGGPVQEPIKVDATIRITDKEFEEELADKTSQAFREMEEEVCGVVRRKSNAKNYTDLV